MRSISAFFVASLLVGFTSFAVAGEAGQEDQQSVEPGQEREVLFLSCVNSFKQVSMTGQVLYELPFEEAGSRKLVVANSQLYFTDRGQLYNGKLRQVSPALPAHASSLTFMPNGNLLVHVHDWQENRSNELVEVDPETGTINHRWPTIDLGNSSGQGDLAVSGEGAYFVSAVTTAQGSGIFYASSLEMQPKKIFKKTGRMARHSASGRTAVSQPYAIHLFDENGEEVDRVSYPPGTTLYVAVRNDHKGRGLRPNSGGPIAWDSQGNLIVPRFKKVEVEQQVYLGGEYVTKKAMRYECVFYRYSYQRETWTEMFPWRLDDTKEWTEEPQAIMDFTIALEDPWSQDTPRVAVTQE